AVGAADASGARTVRIFSRPAGDTHDTDDAWTEHATGTLATGTLATGALAAGALGAGALGTGTRATGAPATGAEVAGFDASAWPPPDAVAIDLTGYHDADGHGPAFHTVRAAWRGDEEGVVEGR